MGDEWKERLNLGGIDAEDGISRMNGNEVLYRRLLLKFPQDDNFKKFMENIEKEDLPNAKIYVHALKGLTANLGIKILNQECLRADELLKNNIAPDNIGFLANCYNTVIDVIQSILA